jgi:hypothetical protein
MPSMHQLAVTMMIQRLKALATILKKGAEYAEQRGFDPQALIDARLSPDMFPLARQVQIATDMAKSAAARLAGVEGPTLLDDETSFPELQERIARTLSFLKGVKSAQLDGSETRPITLQLRTMKLEFAGQEYLLDWVLPNVFFHVTTAYNILRHNGVPLGKSDYLGVGTGAGANTAKQKAPAKRAKPKKKK